MHLDICSTIYEIRVTADPLLNALGEQVDALAHQRDRALYIRDTVPPDERIDMLSHEALHPLVWAGAEVRDQEDAAKLAKTVSRIIRKQLPKQGGVDALERLVPDAWKTPERMEFDSAPIRVCGFTHSVKVSPRVPEGRAGLTIWASREILIHPSVPPQSRLEVLGHEYFEAYLMHYPNAKDKEKACDLFASLFVQLLESLNQIGGADVIQHLAPEPGVDARTPASDALGNSPMSAIVKAGDEVTVWNKVFETGDTTGVIAVETGGVRVRLSGDYIRSKVEHSHPASDGTVFVSWDQVELNTALIAERLAASHVEPAAPWNPKKAPAPARSKKPAPTPADIKNGAILTKVGIPNEEYTVHQVETAGFTAIVCERPCWISFADLDRYLLKKPAPAKRASLDV